MGASLTMPDSVAGIARLPLRYYGDISRVAGSSQDLTSTRALAELCTASDNVALLIFWVERLRSSEWRVCDVGTVEGGRILDTSARLCDTATAKEWVSKDFLLFQTAGNVLMRAGMDLSTVEFRDFEVLRYGVGSFFSAHADRNRGEGHLGTLVAVVATVDAAGGELHVDGDGDSYEGVPVGTGTPYITFIPLGRVHSVTRVTSGTRYVAKAAVFSSNSADLAVNTAFLQSKMLYD